MLHGGHNQIVDIHILFNPQISIHINESTAQHNFVLYQLDMLI